MKIKIILLLFFSMFIFTNCVNVENQQKNIEFQNKVKAVKVVDNQAEVENCTFVKDIKVDTFLYDEIREQIDAVDFAIEKVAKANANTFYMEKLQMVASGANRDEYLIEGKAYICK